MGRDPRISIQDQGTLQIKPLRVSVTFYNSMFTILKARDFTECNQVIICTL